MEAKSWHFGCGNGQVINERVATAYSCGLVESSYYVVDGHHILFAKVVGW